MKLLRLLCEIYLLQRLWCFQEESHCCSKLRSQKMCSGRTVNRISPCKHAANTKMPPSLQELQVSPTWRLPLSNSLCYLQLLSQRLMSADHRDFGFFRFLSIPEAGSHNLFQSQDRGDFPQAHLAAGEAPKGKPDLKGAGNQRAEPVRA